MSTQEALGEFILGKGQVRKRKIPAIKVLRSGVKARRDPNNPQRGWVTCPVGGPGCEGERYIQLNSECTGRCRTCFGYTKQTHGIGERHASGAIPLYDEWDPASPYTTKKRAFLCANPDNNPDCLKKSYGWTSDFKDPKWGGKCQACVRFGGGHRKIKTDRILKNGTKILLTKENERGEVPIEYFLCKHQRWESRDQALAHAKRLGTLCRACYEDPTALAERIVANKLSEIADQAANSSEKQKKGQGREPGSVVYDDAFFAEVEALVLELHKELRFDGEVTLKAVVERLELRGPSPTEGALAKLVNRRRKQTWKKFVAAVLRESTRH
jgi:hypothetical protein